MEAQTLKLDITFNRAWVLEDFLLMFLFLLFGV